MPGRDFSNTTVAPVGPPFTSTELPASRGVGRIGSVAADCPLAVCTVQDPIEGWLKPCDFRTVESHLKKDALAKSVEVAALFFPFEAACTIALCSEPGRPVGNEDSLVVWPIAIRP